MATFTDTSSLSNPVLGGAATWQISIKKDVFAEPMVVVSISKTGKTVILERLHIISKITGHAPSYNFLGYDHWHYVYTEEEIRSLTVLEPKTFVARKADENLWFMEGTADKVNFGYAMASFRQRKL